MNWKSAYESAIEQINKFLQKARVTTTNTNKSITDACNHASLSTSQPGKASIAPSHTNQAYSFAYYQTNGGRKIRLTCLNLFFLYTLKFYTKLGLIVCVSHL